MESPIDPRHADLTAAFKILPQATALVAADPPRFTVLAASDTLLHILQRSRDDVVGGPLARAWPNANATHPSANCVADLHASIESAIRSGEPQHMRRQRCDLSRADGGWDIHYWDAVNIPMRDRDGHVRHVLHQMVDVTSEVTGAALAAAAEHRAEAILERMSDAHCVLDRDFRIVSVNAAAERVLARGRETLLGRSHWEVFPASYDAPVGRAFREVVAQRIERHFTHHYTGEGYDFHLEVDAYPTDEGGLAMFWRDISERVRAEEALRDSEAKYRALFSEMDEAYAVVEVMADEAGRWTDFLFLEVNAAFMRHTGMPYPVGRTATQLLGTPNPGWAELYGRAAQSGESIRLEESELTIGRTFDLNIFRLGGEGSRRVAVLFSDITARKEAESRLRESESRYRLLFENMGEGFALGEMLWDANGRPVDWRYVDLNAAWAQTGVPVNEAIGRTAREVDPQIEPYWIDAYARVVQTGEPVAFESYAAGFDKWFDTTAFKHSDNRFGVIFRDSSERRKRDAERREHAERQVFLLELGDAMRGKTEERHVAHVALELLAQHLSVDRAYTTTTDYVIGETVVSAEVRRGELPPLPGVFRHSDFPDSANVVNEGTLVIDDAGSDAHLAEANRESLKAVRMGALISVGLRKGDHEVFWTLGVAMTGPREWRRSEVLLMEEAAERILSALTRARAEQALSASEERLRTVIDNLRDYAIMTLDHDGCFTSWNDGARRITGYDAHEVLGRPVDHLYTQADIAAGKPAQELSRAIQTGRSEDESWRVRKDGSRFWVNEIVRPLRDAHGSITGFVKISRDLTERKASEVALQQAHDMLESRVRERTAEVQSLFARLVSAQEDERRRIARDIHDHVGQQMTALRINIEALRSHGGRRKVLAQQIERTQRLAEELDQSIDSLTWQLRPAALDHLGLAAALQHLVTDWSQRFSIKAEFAAHDVDDVRLPQDVEANVYRIAQEALHNVAKHARATEVTIYLLRRGDELMLVVEDNGVGFDEVVMTGAGEERGMGLLNMRERAALAGGRLDIESTPGRGTSLYVRIPAGTRR